MVEFVVADPFIYSQFCALLKYFESFRENGFCEVLLALKTSRYLSLA